MRHKSELALTLRPLPLCVKVVPLKRGGDGGVKGQAVIGARELQKEVFNEQPPACMEIVFHTPLSSLMPNEGWCVHLPVSVYVCKCVQVTHILLG